MKPFQHLAPPSRLFVGPDSLEALGRELDRARAGRALIVCGRSLAREVPLLGHVRSALGARCVGVFGTVQAHSPVPSVAEAAAEMTRLAADSVIAVGGGSAMVTARAACILAAESGDVASLATSRNPDGSMRSPKLRAPKAVVMAVPTTPTTAVAKAGSAVSDPVTGSRLALFDPKTRAQGVFIHPAMAASAPASLAAGAALNTMSLAIEGLLATGATLISDAALMQALRILTRNLSDRARFDDETVRMESMVAAVLCGQGTESTGAGLATVLGHALGHRFHVQGGIGNLIALPAVLRFNAGHASAGIGNVAEAFGCRRDAEPVDTAERIAAAIETICRVWTIPRRLRDIGVPPDGVGAIAADAMGDWFIRANPRPVRASSELESLLTSLW